MEFRAGRAAGARASRGSRRDETSSVNMIYNASDYERVAADFYPTSLSAPPIEALINQPACRRP